MAGFDLVGPEEVLSFWLDEVTPEAWYNSTPELDQTLRTRFEATWEQAQSGGLGQWLTYASGTLAYIILNDQFPRNMFRGTGKAFASDQKALAAAKIAIHKKWDLKIDAPARQFFYVTLTHSENLCDQERAVRMYLERMAEAEDHLLHAQAHREVIRQFGRFPYRNEVLGRTSSDLEQAYLSNGGYGYTLRTLQSAKATAA